MKQHKPSLHYLCSSVFICGNTFFLCSLIIAWLASSTRADTAYNPDANKSDFTTFETTWHDADRNRDVPVKIYYPTTAPAAAGKLPIIIFSHGLGGSREGYSYLGKYWASHGYVSVHLTHHGSDTQAVFDKGMAGAMAAANAADRYYDVRFAIDQLTDANKDDASPLKGRLDLQHIGISGHSFGAGTTLLVIGEQTRGGKIAADPRIKCAIAMSIPVTTPQAHWDQEYAKIKIPLFVMTGTKDDSPVGETKAPQRRVPYDHVQDIPAYLLTLDGGDHMVFSGRRFAGDRPDDPHFHDLILQGSIAFWDAYLREDESAKTWLKDSYAKSVGNDGVFEQK